MKDWLHATKWEIEKMTFDEAKEIMEKQISLGHTDSKFRPREHTTHAYEMILGYADKYVRFVKLLVNQNENKLETPMLSYPTNHCKLYQCPTCGNPVSWKEKACKLCGQNLDWAAYENKTYLITIEEGGDEQ